MTNLKPDDQIESQTPPTGSIPEVFILSACVGDDTIIAEKRWRSITENGKPRQSICTMGNAPEERRKARIMELFSEFLDVCAMDNPNKGNARHLITRMFSVAATFPLNTLEDFVEFINENREQEEISTEDLRRQILPFLGGILKDEIQRMRVEGPTPPYQPPLAVDQQTRKASLF